MSRVKGAASTPATRGQTRENPIFKHLRDSRLRPEKDILDNTVFVVFVFQSAHGTLRFFEWFHAASESSSLYDYALLQRPELETEKFQLQIAEHAIDKQATIGMISGGKPRIVVRLVVMTHET